VSVSSSVVLRVRRPDSEANLDGLRRYIQSESRGIPEETQISSLQQSDTSVPGPGEYDLHPEASPYRVECGAHSAFASGSPRFGRRSLVPTPISAFDCAPVRAPDAAPTPRITSTPRFREIPADGAGAQYLHVRNQSIEDRLVHAGNTAVHLRSPVDRFVSLASSVLNQPRVPRLRFANEDAPARGS
jgi:hypothetical protein